MDPWTIPFTDADRLYEAKIGAWTLVFAVVTLSAQYAIPR